MQVAFVALSVVKRVDQIQRVNLTNVALAANILQEQIRLARLRKLHGVAYVYARPACWAILILYGRSCGLFFGFIEVEHAELHPAYYLYLYLVFLLMLATLFVALIIDLFAERLCAQRLLYPLIFHNR